MAKILVVDDERDVIELIQFALEKEGHHVRGATNGKEGLEAVKADRPDLIVLDIMMPIMDGFTMNSQLLLDYESRKIPIIVLTAKGQMRDVFEATPNVKRYLDKPFDPSDLRRQVAAVLQNASAS